MKKLSYQPLVSCIMPTRNRSRFILQAIHYFLRQDYTNLELVIVDDGDKCVGELIRPFVLNDERIRYIRLMERLSVGAKRNQACDQAAGEIIVHWDDDDWIAPWRVSYQIEQL